MKNYSSTVSIITTTKNEASVLENLLQSIKKQSYQKVEIIIVDNGSVDQTKQIAKKYTKIVFDKGPERSVQRNFGASKAHGDYLLFLDADMELSKNVLKDCVDRVTQDKKIGGVIIPEKSFGTSYWAKVKAFERSFYVGDDSIEAARFFPKKIFTELKGFDEDITGPEDWEFSQKVREKFNIERIPSYIFHNEGELNIVKLIKKKFYYGIKTSKYLTKSNKKTINQQTVYFLRPCFYRNYKKIICHPFMSISLIIMFVFELSAGGAGYIFGKFVK